MQCQCCRLRSRNFSRGFGKGYLPHRARVLVAWRQPLNFVRPVTVCSWLYHTYQVLIPYASLLLCSLATVVTAALWLVQR
jgi:hypothetical protein